MMMRSNYSFYLSRRFHYWYNDVWSFFSYRLGDVVVSIVVDALDDAMGDDMDYDWRRKHKDDQYKIILIMICIYSLPFSQPFSSLAAKYSLHLHLHYYYSIVSGKVMMTIVWLSNNNDDDDHDHDDDHDDKMMI